MDGKVADCKKRIESFSFVRLKRPATRIGSKSLRLTESVKAALLLAHEFLESLWLSAAERFNRGRQMLDRVLIKAPLQSPVVRDRW
jgi:hypothetical protein